MAGEKRQCMAILPSGGRCSAGAEEGQDWCYNHSPVRAEERRKNAAAGGHARSRRSPDELELAKREIRAVTMGVLNGQVDRGIGGTVLHGFNVMLRCVEIQRKLDRQAELEEQVADLRERLEDVKRRRYGTA